eukprot:CAMPEP_0202444044 /NCGR_PEP_ID=MMETSP1360-20130828/3194_1 /ASSEMBLY_ACC=CAM_ASM_000848 /TAXON_ID=515479 /ORGANISM="Licmophora paradoxa, Strain CCMP2313" /LENGTH=194 /DNA_ID=CAMNT_0049059915 /DNA_START=128 /DNA_END=712 /DNA_ORIENTATION=-
MKSLSQIPASKTKKRNAKRVVFHSTPTTIGSSASLQIKETKERNQSCWYQKQDLKRFRLDNTRTALAVHFKQVAKNPKSYVNVIQRTFKLCRLRKVPSQEEMQYLMYWQRFCPERRGLEKLCLPAETAAANRQRVLRTRKAVISVQNSLREKGASLDTISKKLHQVYHALAQPDKIYNRVIAIADASSENESSE